MNTTTQLTKLASVCAGASLVFAALVGCASDPASTDAALKRAEAPAPAPAPGPAPGASRDGWVYMLRLSRPDIFETATEAERAAFAGHVAYIKELTRKGVVIVAGPLTDDPPLGLVIFEASDEAAAREIMLGDPGIPGGVFSAELRPMRLSSLRERDLPKQP